MEQSLILVDEHDRETGTASKSVVHQKGLLHRAFSIFLFNSKGEMLVQQRAAGKYHSGGLWTNACCSHPLAGEKLEEAVSRRLKEELGIKANVDWLFSFIYRAEFENGTIEHEFDHVFVGEYDGEFTIDPAEIADHRFVDMYSLQQSIEAEPSKYTSWFKLAFPGVMKWWRGNEKLEMTNDK